jgi:hypothetical protein
MMAQPGESFWVSSALVRGRSNRLAVLTVGLEVRVVAGSHIGSTGHIRAVDGGSDMVQVRTGDPKEWEMWDAETLKMLEEMGR